MLHNMVTQIIDSSFIGPMSRLVGIHFQLRFTNTVTIQMLLQLCTPFIKHGRRCQHENVRTRLTFHCETNQTQYTIHRHECFPKTHFIGNQCTTISGQRVPGFTNGDPLVGVE